MPDLKIFAEHIIDYYSEEGLESDSVDNELIELLTLSPSQFQTFQADRSSSNSNRDLFAWPDSKLQPIVSHYGHGVSKAAVTGNT